MEHSDFVTHYERTEFLWGVKGFYRPLFRIWGPTEGAFVVGVSVAVLACSFGYAAWILHSGSYIALLWLLPSVYGFLAGHPGLTGIELLLYTGLAIVGLFLGGHHVIGGLLPGLSWFAIGAIKGISIGMIGENLVRSKELFEAARDDGTHMLPVPNKTLQPTGEDARRQSVIVSCGEPLWV